MNAGQEQPTGVELQLLVEKLYSRSATYLDDGPIEKWPELFTEDCSYQIVPRDNFDLDLPLAIVRCDSRLMLLDRVQAVKKTMMYEPRYLRHQITNVQILETDDDSHSVCANFTAVEVLPDSLPRILISGRYLDEVVWRDGGLLFAAKKCVYDSVLVPNSIIYPV